MSTCILTAEDFYKRSPLLPIQSYYVWAQETPEGNKLNINCVPFKLTLL